MDKLKEAHDKLLAEKSDEDTHDEISCPFCNPELKLDSEEGGNVETFTKEQLDAAIALAVAPLQAELDSLKNAQVEDETSAQIAQAQAEADARVAEVQTELDAKVLEAAEATRKFEELEAFLADSAAAEQAAAQFEALKTERLAAIKEVASFPADHIDKNIERWVAMDEDSFADQLETWKLLSTASDDSDSDDGKVPETAMKQTRSESGKLSFRDTLSNINKTAKASGISIKSLN